MSDDLGRSLTEGCFVGQSSHEAEASLESTLLLSAVSAGILGLDSEVMMVAFIRS